MAGTPLLGDQLLLETYSYLDDSAVHLLQPGETDAAAMARLLALPAFEVIQILMVVIAAVAMLLSQICQVSHAVVLL